MKKPKLNQFSLLFLLGAVAYATPAYYVGDPTIQRAAFVAAAGSPLTLESFETSFVSSTSVSFPIGGPAAFTVTSTNAITLSAFARGVSDGDLAVSFNESGSNSLRFTFVNPILLFGVDLNDLNFTNATYVDSNGNTQVNALLGDNGGSAGGPAFENRQFFGVVDPQGFTFVEFQTNGTGTGFIYADRLQYGTSIAAAPEPASASFFALGLSALLCARFRRTAIR